MEPGMSTQREGGGIGFRVRWENGRLLFSLFTEDENGTVVEGAAAVERSLLDALPPDQRSQWFWLQTVWPYAKSRVLMLVGFVLLMLCMLTLLAVQLAKGITP
jgi:hypothetical protein